MTHIHLLVAAALLQCAQKPAACPGGCVRDITLLSSRTQPVTRVCKSVGVHRIEVPKMVTHDRQGEAQGSYWDTPTPCSSPVVRSNATVMQHTSDVCSLVVAGDTFDTLSCRRTGLCSYHIEETIWTTGGCNCGSAAGPYVSKCKLGMCEAPHACIDHTVCFQGTCTPYVACATCSTPCSAPATCHASERGSSTPCTREEVLGGTCRMSEHCCTGSCCSRAYCRTDTADLQCPEALRETCPEGSVCRVQPHLTCPGCVPYHCFLLDVHTPLAPTPLPDTEESCCHSPECPEGRVRSTKACTAEESEARSCSLITCCPTYHCRSHASQEGDSVSGSEEAGDMSSWAVPIAVCSSALLLVVLAFSGMLATSHRASQRAGRDGGPPEGGETPQCSHVVVGVPLPPHQQGGQEEVALGVVGGEMVEVEEEEEVVVEVARAASQGCVGGDGGVGGGAAVGGGGGPPCVSAQQTRAV